MKSEMKPEITVLIPEAVPLLLARSQAGNKRAQRNSGNKAFKTKSQTRVNQMVRLKDKLGTRQLPTAELLLDGVKVRWSHSYPNNQEKLF